MKKCLKIINGFIGFSGLFTSTVLFVSIIVSAYQGNIIPQDIFHIFGVTLVVGIFTTLNSIYLEGD
ncbi:hypothetical protein AXI64_gp055 [Vibrio phage qdvp001]|uniref:hypothetical protein n=1 Tax=Vibrio phage qdvp001 TaxID=1003177 RepID=UPI00071F9B64|nr:hypothetical protein AXI64_gp055 [Vibrio phage qdvp001]ALM62047.1 hypothetical protein qdvp001_055 [Vibrio phage qdvp001]